MAQNKEHPPFFKSVRNYFREYCNYSSIHGFRYFGEKRTYFERGWWFIVFALTLTGCIIAIRAVYVKWINSPVIVSFATKETPIYFIPFPAVTICPEAKTNQKLYNHTSIIRKLIEKKELTPREKKLCSYMKLICSDFHLMDSPDRRMYDDDFFDELVNISYTRPFFKCSYMGEAYDCYKLFKPIITPEGICYTFNMLNRSEIFKEDVVHYKNFHVMENSGSENWTMDKGYSDAAGVKTYPRRAILSGAENSLMVTLITRKTYMDDTCKESVQGYRVLLHTPMRLPNPKVEYFRVPNNQVVMAAIQPMLINTADSVKVFNPIRRECFFPNEKPLMYFKIYTSLNCKLECLTNFTLSSCGCVNFFMPRNDTTKICGIAKKRCMRMAEDVLQMGNLYKKIEKPKNNTNETDNISPNMYQKLPDCDCKPICSDLTYHTEISQNDWNWFDFQRGFQKKESLPFDRDEIHMSRLTLFFKSSQFISSLRHELYGPTDFLANFGGLLGLFTGFSILSLMEAIYFLTVRLCCNSRLYGYWAGPDQQVF